MESKDNDTVYCTLNLQIDHVLESYWNLYISEANQFDQTVAKQI